MRAEIITSGTELLLGEITDTNTPYLAKHLAEIGVNVYHHTTVGDNAGRLLEAIKSAEKRAEIIIISGGLGPTQDDITKDVLADYLAVDLVLDDVSFKKATKRYQTENISKGNYRQALILKGAQVLANDVGMAAGTFSEIKERVYVLLPGPPNEFERMVKHYLLPKLIKIVHAEDVLRSRTLNFYGVGESVFAEKIDRLVSQQSNPTIAIYAKEGIIDIRLTASASTDAKCRELLDEMEKKILDILSPYFLGYEKTTIEELIFTALERQNKNISLIETQVGGNILQSWRKHLKSKKTLKGSLYFSYLAHALKYYGVGSEQKESIIETETEIIKYNEKLVTHLQKDFQTDYGVAISSYGGLREEIYRVYVSVGRSSGEICTQVIDFSERSYFPPWLIRLRVNEVLWKFLDE